MWKTTDKNGEELTVEKSARGCFAINDAEGNELGFAEFKDREDERIFYHTVVEPKAQGRGIASALIKIAVEQSVAEGKLLVPVCSMVDHFLTKHSEDYEGKFRPAEQSDAAAV